MLSSSEFSEKSSFSQTCSLLSQYMKEKGNSLRELSLGMSTFDDGNGMPMAASTMASNDNNAMNLFPLVCQSNVTPSMKLNSTFMDLFPQHSGFGPNVSEELDPNMGGFGVMNKPEPEAKQMTIFYDGQVIVFNDISADKAEEITLLASKGTNSQVAPNIFASASMQRPVMTPNSVHANSIIIGLNFMNSMVPEHVDGLSSTTVTDIPIARKASLTRFLEKRKDRISARTPYQKSNSRASPLKPPVKNKSWLGLAPQSPEQIDHLS